MAQLIEWREEMPEVMGSSPGRCLFFSRVLKIQNSLQLTPEKVLKYQNFLQLISVGVPKYQNCRQLTPERVPKYHNCPQFTPQSVLQNFTKKQKHSKLITKKCHKFP